RRAPEAGGGRPLRGGPGGGGGGAGPERRRPGSPHPARRVPAVAPLAHGAGGAGEVPRPPCRARGGPARDRPDGGHRPDEGLRPAGGGGIGSPGEGRSDRVTGMDEVTSAPSPGSLTAIDLPRPGRCARRCLTGRRTAT